MLRIEREGFGIAKPETNFFQKGIWLCPAAKWSSGTIAHVSPQASYAYNRFGVVFRGNTTNAFGLEGHYDDQLQTWTPITEAEVAIPSDMIAIGDSYNAAIQFNRDKLADIADRGNFFMRHRGKVNVLLCESHVESAKLKALYEDTTDAALSRWNRDHLPRRDRVIP